MNFLAQFVSDHPIAAVVIGVIVVGRILTRDISRANKFIQMVNDEKSMINKIWSGADRRGPNRAKNVIRPSFNQTTIIVKENEIAEVNVKTGTDN